MRNLDRCCYKALGVSLWTALLCAPSEAQVRAGGALLVNTYTTDTEGYPGIAVARDGDFVVAWMSNSQDGSDTGVFAQRFDRTGARRGAEFQVNTYTTDYQQFLGRVGAASDARGRFVIAWASYGQDGSGWGVFAQRYDAGGTPAGPEFQVNTFTLGYQGSRFIYSTVATAMSARGEFVVVWTSYYQDGSFTGIFGQRYDARGATIGREFQVNTLTPGYQSTPEVAMNAAGDFVVAWTGYDGSLYGVRARRFNVFTGPRGAEFAVNTYTTGAQGLGYVLSPGVAVGGSGAFSIVWTSANQDGSIFGVFGQAFSPEGKRVGPEFQVNTFTPGAQVLPSARADASGNFVVVWQSLGQDGSHYGIFGQRFTAAGARRGGEFQVNTYTFSAQVWPAVGSDAVGNFAVAWGGLSPVDTLRTGVTLQRYGGLLPSALRVDTLDNGVFEPKESRDVRPSWRNVNGAAQTFGASALGFSGPPAIGVEYQLTDASATYGTVANGATAECVDCYQVGVTFSGARPALHWDATLDELIAPDVLGQRKQWAVHIGASFSDVSRTSQFYPFVETLLHNGITSGCAADTYCPGSSATREQMAPFVLVAREGAGYLPTACDIPVFGDVPPSSPFCPWIQELARRGVTGGCGGGNYCPTAAVSREQMAVFVLRTLDPTLNPPACATPVFNDVPASSPF